MVNTQTVETLRAPTIGYKFLEQYPADGLRTYQVTIDGKEQDAQHIVRTNAEGVTELITQQRMLYKVIPNSTVLKAADAVALEVKAVPWTEFTGPWFVKPKSHIMENARHTQVHALYAFNEPVAIRPGDKIQLGFSIHNSIDGSMGLGGGMFTFRHACQNMFFMGFKGQGMSFDERQVLAYFYKKHTQEVSTEQLAAIMTKVNEKALDVIAALRKMTTVNLLPSEAVKVSAVLGKEQIETIAWLKFTDKDKKQVELARKVSKYDAWNDLTDLASHNKDLGLESMMDKHRIIERVLLAPLMAQAGRRAK